MGPSGTMKAIVRRNGTTELSLVPVPQLGKDEVLIRVAATGLCRTDLYAAQGKLKIKEPLVLGHEFSGVVVLKGANAQDIGIGSRVAVMPVLSCLECPECGRKEFNLCGNPKQLGVDLDGSFAEYVKVPAAAVYPIPDALSFPTAAFAEPVAAALALTAAGLSTEDNLLLLGKGRIAELSLRVLAAVGFKKITLCTDQASINSFQPSSFDAAIETSTGTLSVNALAKVVRGRGAIIIKSRSCDAASLNWLPLMRKEIAVKPVFYGSFAQALELLSSGAVIVKDLMGPFFRLEEFETLFREAEAGEALKPFFVID